MQTEPEAPLLAVKRKMYINFLEEKTTEAGSSFTIGVANEETAEETKTKIMAEIREALAREGVAHAELAIYEEVVEGLEARVSKNANEVADELLLLANGGGRKEIAGLKIW